MLPPSDTTPLDSRVSGSVRDTRDSPCQGHDLIFCDRRPPSPRLQAIEQGYPWASGRWDGTPIAGAQRPGQRSAEALVRGQRRGGRRVLIRGRARSGGGRACSLPPPTIHATSEISLDGC